MSYQLEIQPESFNYFSPELSQETLEMEQFEFLESEVNRNASDYIRWVQNALNKILGLQLKVDGIIGPQTRSAIRSFQQRQGLKTDGIFGKMTERAIISKGINMPRSLSSNNPHQNIGIDCSTVNMHIPDNWRKNKVRREGADEKGRIVDRIRDYPSSSVLLARELTHYDVNDWQTDYKEIHRHGIYSIGEEIGKYLNNNQTSYIRVTITGGADIPGGSEYNKILSCKRARYAERQIFDTVNGLYPNVLPRLSFNTNGKGYLGAKCKNKSCYDPDYRSTLIVAHPINLSIPPIPPLPDRNTCEFKIRCCSFESKGLLTFALDSILEGNIPKELEYYLTKYPVLKKAIKFIQGSILSFLKKKIPIINKLGKRIGEITKYIYVELIQIYSLIEIVERSKSSSQSRLLDYNGYGFRVKKPSIPMPSEISDLINKLPLPVAVREQILKNIKSFFNDEIGLGDLKSTCAGEFVNFRLINLVGSNNKPICTPKPIDFFVGSSSMGTAGQAFVGTTTSSGKIGIAWNDDKFPITGPRISCSPNSECWRKGIWLPLGFTTKGSEVFISSEGALSLSSKKCSLCTVTFGRR